MLSAEIMRIVVGVSTPLGLFSAIGYGIVVLLGKRRFERSVREAVEGEGTFNLKDVVRILREFPDDEGKREALKTLTRHDYRKAQALLGKIKANVDVGRLNTETLQTWRKSFGIAAMALLGVAILAWLYSVAAPEGSAKIAAETNREAAGFTGAESILDSKRRMDQLLANFRQKVNISDHCDVSGGCWAMHSYEAVLSVQEPCAMELHRSFQWNVAPSRNDTDYYELMGFDLRKVIVETSLEKDNEGLRLVSIGDYAPAVYYARYHTSNVGEPFSFEQLRMNGERRNVMFFKIAFVDADRLDRVRDEMRKMQYICGKREQERR